MKLFTSTILCILCLPVHTTILCSQKAVVNVPIADLIGQQFTTLIPQDVEQSYARLPVCSGEIKSSIACPRLHQLLYNDIVEITKSIDDEVCIRIAHAYYLTPSSPQHHTTYWTLKKNITPFDDIAAHNISVDHIPEPINFSDTHHTALTHQAIVTLIEPHHDTKMNKLFSAGTRFVKTASPRKKKASTIEVFAIDFGKMKQFTLKIPCNKCIVGDSTKTPEQRIAEYVELLKKWSHQKRGFISYVWGGTSFTKTINTPFKEITTTGHNGDYSFYEYEKDTQAPKNGLDCSGAVLRAAQICGIPYFCKNTTTIAQCLTPLAPVQQLRAGDLIVIKGHVMVVSDIDKNLLIEARSYGHGYGKLLEIPLNQVFEGIETYKDLCDVHYEKKVIKRKDKEGKIRDTFSNLQLFPMMSAFNKQGSQ